MAKTIVGLFDQASEAQRAVTALEQAGISRDAISLAAAQDSDFAQSTSQNSATTDDSSSDRAANAGLGAAKGAGLGAAVGGGAGLLLGLLGAGLIAVPGIGPIIAAGPLAAALTGAGIGAVTGGLIGGLTQLGVPEEHAHAYAEGVRRGGTLLTVRAEDGEAQRVADLLNQQGAVDVDQRATAWREKGWTRFDEKSAPFTREQVAEERAAFAKIPVVQEQVAVGKREVDRGGVRVYNHVVEQAVDRDVTLRQESVDVQRNRVDRPVGAQDAAALRDQVIEVRATAEEAVVAKEARVVEEVVVQKNVGQRVEHVHETVKRSDVKVEPLAASGSNASAVGATGKYDQLEAEWRDNYRTAYGTSGLTYETVAPAYRYGHETHSDARFRGKDWNTVEPELRRD